jgi:hypothetical protein
MIIKIIICEIKVLALGGCYSAWRQKAIVFVTRIEKLLKTHSYICLSEFSSTLQDMLLNSYEYFNY